MEAKIKATEKKVSQLSKQEKVNTTKVSTTHSELSIWEKEVSYNRDSQRDLREVHITLPEPDPLSITMADIQERVSRMKSLTAPGPDMVHSYRLKNT